MPSEFVGITDPAEERPQVFDYANDLALFNGFANEFSDIYLLNLNYYSFDWDTSTPSNIYGEQDTKTYRDPVRIRANAELNPPKKRLEKWGIQHPRDVIFLIAMTKFEQANISPQVDDQIEYEHVMYRVTEVQKAERIEGTNQAMSVSLFCERIPKKERAAIPS